MNSVDNLRCLSASYKYTKLDQRGLVYLSEEDTKFFLSNVKDILGIQELLFISTCNRIEIYYVSEIDLNADIISLLKSVKNIQKSTKELLSYFTNRKGINTCEHLYKVSLGLDSQILGDLQIISQVKKAYQLSCDYDLAGMILHRLLHAIFFTNKQVVQSTSFRDGTASVSYSCFSLTEQLAKTFINPEILVIGAGEMGRDTCLHLSKNQKSNVTIINRTLSKAKLVAEECSFAYGEYNKLKNLIKQSQIIISTVESDSPIITKEILEELDINFKFFIDLSVPASIESSIEELNGIQLFNIDDLQGNIDEVQKKRKSSIPLIEEMITNSINEFVEWGEEITVSPIINQLKSSLEGIRRDEIARYSKNISCKEKEVIEDITQAMIQKIIKFPVMELKSACKRGEEEKLSEIVQELFNLEKAKNYKLD